MIVKTMVVGKREENKRKTRTALEKAAWELIDRKGYENTTVSEVSAVVGVSERTFYRYFDSKEAVLFAGWREQLDEFEKFIRSRPAEEDILTSLREFSRAWALVTQSDLERIRKLHSIAEGSVAVREYENSQIVSTLRTRVASIVHDRLPRRPDAEPEDDDYRASLLTGLFIELLVSTKRRWVAEGGDLLVRVEAAWRATVSLGLRV